MDFELKVNGTPAKFAVMVELFDWRLWGRYKENGPHFHTPGQVEKIPADTNLVTIHFTDINVSSRGTLTAQSTHDNKTLLTVWVEDDMWSELEPAWNLLHEELGRQGWLDGGAHQIYDIESLSNDFAQSKKPRSDVLKRVANAKLLIDDNIAKNRRDAAEMAGTSTNSISKYENHPKVIEWENYFKENKSELNRFRRDSGKENKSKLK